MAYGFPDRPRQGGVPIRQPMGGGQRPPMGGGMPSKTPGRPMPARAGAQRKVFNPEQEMEIRRIVQEVMRR